MLYLILGAVALAAAPAIFYAWYRYWTTAYVLVHAWNFGGSEAEIQRNLAQFRHFMHLDKASIASLTSKHENYYIRLRQGLKWLFCRFIVVVDFAEREAEVATKVQSMVPRLVNICYVESKVGRATPAHGTWKALAQSLSDMNFRRVYIIGCYLGMHNGTPVDPEVLYFCVNDMLFHLRGSGLFSTVETVDKLCYVHDVPELPTPPKTPTAETGRAKRRKEKKKKKKRR